MRSPVRSRSGPPLAQAASAPASSGNIKRKLTLLPLIAATYFMVSGGPYGLEDVISGAGYNRALLLLLITPIVWSLPVCLLIGELAAALPQDGGYYVWVERGLGPF